MTPYNSVTITKSFGETAFLRYISNVTEKRSDFSFTIQ